VLPPASVAKRPGPSGAGTSGEHQESGAGGRLAEGRPQTLRSPPATAKDAHAPEVA
jgi:hypothetical protein